MKEDILPGAQTFLGVMERTIQLVGDTVPQEKLKQVAEVLHTLRWEFKDYGIKVFFLVSLEGEVSCATEWEGTVDSAVTMDADTFHNAAYGRANLGAAVLMGKVRIEGISMGNLGRFASLLNPFLSSYRQACEELNGAAE